MRRHPHLYEINTWPWLDRLRRKRGERITLGSIPDDVWDALRARGVDFVYLMGIWTRSALGRQIARTNPAAWNGFADSLPGWRARDVVGSAYSITAYQPDPALGTMADLDRVRTALRARGMALIVDFIPNHVGFDHPWIHSHPDRFIAGTEENFRANTLAFRPVELSPEDVRFIARARDPYFPPWSDVAQLDYSRADTRRAMLDELQYVAAHADGIRCDMAMLVLSDVFESTWRGLAALPTVDAEFWPQARAAVPDCLLIAEAYWDLEWRLQGLGFDYTYDKRLYDRLLHDGAGAVVGHLMADARYQERSVRFIENHDEPRSADAFGPRLQAVATAMSTLPGLRFYHDGQFEGRRVRLPVQLGRELDEPVDAALTAFYDRLLRAVDASVFHEGEWTLCQMDGASGGLLAWRWRHGRELRVVVVNLGGDEARGRIDVSADLASEGDQVVCLDLLDDARRVYPREELATEGLRVQLPVGGARILALTTRPSPEPPA